MGAWSTTIMGGDTPLDVEGMIYDMLGVEQYPEGEEPNTTIDLKPLLEEKQDWLLSVLKGKEFEWAEGEQLLVLGWMMCTGGAKINSEVKEALVKACDDDEWAKTDNERAKHVAQLRDAVIACDGSGTFQFTEEGLFQKLAQHLNEGKEGLINL